MNRSALFLAGLALSLPALADEAQLMDQARKVAMAIPPKLLEVLHAEIKAGGPAEAIGVCREKAPKMAAAASAESGWAIRRVSLKNRNPKAVPDAWEKSVLEDFEKRLAAGEKPTGLERGEVVEAGDGKVYRYMKALPTQDVCLQCHGTDDRIPPEVKAKLKELYPEDKAVGYGPAEIRGAITLKRPL
jgi:hypothetical protein